MRSGRSARALVEGAVDVHVHAAPSLRKRYADAWEIAHEAAAVGMAGVLLKDHDRCTVGDADLVNSHGNGVRLYGSVCCNAAAGGVNPAAVEAALALGASMVFLPTTAARSYRDFETDYPAPVRMDAARQTDGGPNSAISLFGPDGELTRDVREVIKLCAGFDATLATGHLSAAEVVSVLAAATDAGTRVVVTHAPAYTLADLETMRGWARSAYLELCYVFCCAHHLQPEIARRNVAMDARLITAVGAEAVVLSTDLGQANNVAPAEGLVAYVDGLLAEGIPESGISRMLRDNPRIIVGADREMPCTT